MTHRLRTALPLAVLALAVLAAAYVGGTAPDGPPLDPRSTGPSGTRALVDTLQELGAEVRLGARPEADDTALLVLSDRLDDADRDAVLDWVRGGGVLVVADPASPLAAEPVGPLADGLVAPTLEAGCDVPAAVAAGTVQATGLAYSAGEDDTGCFAGDAGHWLVAEAVGSGARVSLGSPDPLTNVQLRDAGHAVLAVGLLAPDAEQARVRVVTPPLPGEGEATLVDLVPRSVWAALAQLGIAFALVAAWRARRLARPVAERQPVELPASELVVANGDLLADARARGRAAALLRAELRRDLARRAGLPPAVPDGELARTLVARHPGAREDVDRVFAAGEPAADDDLVALARATERLRDTVLDAGRTEGAAT